ncbi:MAG: hypothetical protein Q9M36_06295 [Sulfurovum sp.]|nr:hypothetical protein [Sulfurovum sp.]
MKTELINIEKLQETIINQAQENSSQEKRIQTLGKSDEILS